MIPVGINGIKNPKLFELSLGWVELGLELGGEGSEFELIFLDLSGGLLSFDLIFIESRNGFSRLEKIFYRFENSASTAGRDLGRKF